MPTRFGNVIKAFETYSDRVYGLEGTIGWARLIGVIPASYASVTNDARAEVDFFVNYCALSGSVGLLALARCIGSFVTAVAGAQCLIFLFSGLAALATAYASYRGAAERASAWGDTVKAAVDLYLPALAKQLGYELPNTGEERLAFWEAVNNQMLQNIPLDPARWKPLVFKGAGTENRKDGQDDNGDEDVKEDDGSSDDDNDGNPKH